MNHLLILKNYSLFYNNSITIHNERFSSEHNDLTYKTSKNFTCTTDAKNDSDTFVEGLCKFIKKSRELYDISYTAEV